MLNQQVRRPNLPLMPLSIRLLRLRLNLARAMVSRHIHLQLFGIGAGGWLPAGELLPGVEVIGQVLGGGVADLPAGRETGVTGCALAGR